MKGISAKRARRQSLRRREVNRHRVRTVRTLIRQARDAVSAGVEGATEDVQRALGALDRAGAAKGGIHPNNAARRKSRLARMLNKSQSET